MRVIIKPKHTIGSDYFDGTDCPLYRAIAEQHPEFPLMTVGMTYIKDIDHNIYFIKSGWGVTQYHQLCGGKKECLVSISKKPDDHIIYPKFLP